ncbi:aminodeoxychorismate lyase [Jeongeupia sp. USM3]|uniref:aminodeoxychorismate lyase n=1 Tax=Jeongeupia sp. USM3 TaxID=1906741 RepID=UPI00089E08FD|nr:aminodeoxychorismate lyase [Jeongeupia sp. USM3]AOY00172.1 aminodeoxychorismate lyase [Jeongeupia sp. USM3]
MTPAVDGAPDTIPSAGGVIRLVDGAPAGALALADRSIQFGDGVFRTLYVRNGGIPFWRRHMARLAHDAAALGIAAPSFETWLAELRAHAPADATIKLVLTRGESPRGYAVPAGCTPHRITQIAPPAAVTDRSAGVTVRVCDTRASWQPRLAGIKHLNRLENVLARSEWRDPEIFDGLLLDRDGDVVEGTMSNVLLLEAGVLLTPKLDTGGVAGVLRDVAFDAAAALGWPVGDVRIDLPRLLRAERVWLCNSLIGLVPVARLGERDWPVHPADHTLAGRIAALATEETEWIG